MIEDASQAQPHLYSLSVHHALIFITHDPKATIPVEP